MRRMVHHYKQVAEQQGRPDKPVAMRREFVGTEVVDEFFIDGLTVQERDTIRQFLTSKNDQIKLVDELPSNLHLRQRHFLEPAVQEKTGYYPDIVENIQGVKFYILKPTEYVHEAAALLAVAFCLGMLARYYPDIWMSVIENNVDVVELTNGLLNVISRKFPNLILDQMTDVKHHVHL